MITTPVDSSALSWRFGSPLAELSLTELWEELAELMLSAYPEPSSRDYRESWRHQNVVTLAVSGCTYRLQGAPKRGEEDSSDPHAVLWLGIGNVLGVLADVVEGE